MLIEGEVWGEISGYLIDLLGPNVGPGGGSLPQGQTLGIIIDREKMKNVHICKGGKSKVYVENA